MAKAVRIGVGDVAASTMMPEQGTETGRGHGLTAPRAFQRDEQGGRVGRRTLQPQIGFEGMDEVLGQREKTLLAAFAQDSYLGRSELEIFQFQSEHFTGAQTDEQQ